MNGNNKILNITSTSNPRIKDIARLRQRSHRDEAGLILIEGYREVKRALDNKYKPYTIVSCSGLFMGSSENTIIERCLQSGAEHITCTPSVFTKISARDRPDGLLAIGPQIHIKLETLSLPDNPLVIVAEAIEKPGNLGTILRSADAAGASAVIVCDKCTDIQNPNVVRASIGTLFSIPVIETSAAETVEFLKNKNFRIIAATPHAENLYSEYDLTGPVAIVVGAEQYGLSDIWLKSGTATLARIPMLGQCDSLNVASAATILIYEAVRQRITANPAMIPIPHVHEKNGDRT